ncbi:cytochrome P450 [Blastocladiella britannica]|nr:cytochrome P450 [Blastocladiella britannica]
MAADTLLQHLPNLVDLESLEALAARLPEPAQAALRYAADTLEKLAASTAQTPRRKLIAASVASYLAARIVLSLARNALHRRRLLARNPFLRVVPVTSLESVLAGTTLGQMTRNPHEAIGAMTALAPKGHVTTGPMGKPHLWVSDPRAIHAMLVTHARRFERTKIARQLLAWATGPLGLLTLEGDDHRRHRRIINPVFNLKNLRTLTPVIAEAAREMSAAVSGGGAAVNVEFTDLASKVALNIIGRTTMAMDFDALNEKQPSPLTEAYHEMTTIMEVYPLARLSRPMPWINSIPFLKHARVFDQAKAVVSRHVDLIVTAFTDAASAGKVPGASTGVVTTPSLVAALLAGSKSGDAALSREELRSELLSFLSAGHETTAMTYAMAVWELGRPHNADIQTALRTEVRRVLSDHHDDAAAAYDALAGCAQLTAVINETLRVHTPAYLIGRRAMARASLPLEDGSTLEVDKEQIIFIPVAAIQRSVRQWGPGAHEWSPRRWLRDDDHGTAALRVAADYESGIEDTLASPIDNGQGSSDKWFEPFAMGPHACIGRQFAIMELRVLLAQLVADIMWTSQDETVAMRWGITAGPMSVKIQAMRVQ